MKELSKTPGISRRRFMVGSAGLAASVVVGFADQKLKDGLIFDEPSLTPHFKRINAALPGIDIPLGRAVELGYKKEFIRLNERSFVHINSDGELIFQHIDAMFDLDREYNIPHRSGNRGHLIDEAIKLGADGFDLDANDTGIDIRAEHGLVGELDLGVVSLGGVWDVDEGEIRSRIPRTVVHVLDHIGSISRHNDPYIMEIELKRGTFADQQRGTEMIGAISRNGLPTRIFSGDQRTVDNLFMTAQLFAQKPLVF